jgi:hypothetical protein
LFADEARSRLSLRVKDETRLLLRPLPRHPLRSV